MIEIEPLTLVLLGAAASGVLILLAVVMAYRLGQDRGLRSRSDRFDRLYVETDFSDTHWTVSDTSDAVTAKVIGTMSLHQSGTRILAEGVDTSNRRWSAEGIAFRRGVHLLFVERRERGHAVGALHLALDESGQSMTGMKSTWEGDKSGGAIETIIWRRMPPGENNSAADDDVFLHRDTATVANRQHRVNVFRPVDRAVTDVVTTASNPSHGGL